MRFAYLALLFSYGISNLLAQTIPAEHLKGINIRSIGPGAMSGRITAIIADPQHPEVIYAGAASGGVWRSKSGGTGWQPIFDKAPTQSVGALAIHPRNPDEIWVGTGEGNPRNSQNFGIGIFKTLDGGENWTCMGLQNTHAIHRVLLHRDLPDVVFAAAMGSTYGPSAERGVFKSSDGGKSWLKVLYVNDLTGCADLVADPRNPNKLYAAMWEYRRWPWFFKSGGPGSGLYVSNDGGETWTRRTEKDGLPEGELGRLGLAVSPSNPDVVYALVEAKDNALYKSTDAGKTWRKMADKNQGDRPFYYGELYVDPKDENTIYSVHSQMTKSIDGGKTFDRWVGFWDIHPDHHAFWISPDNPKYIIEGNDGGINITYDGGTTWRYAENIPVGQFYHVETDNQTPYNVYGGLQDNGSWVGPSAIWKPGGIRNSDWQEVYFGDGFETMPRQDDPRYVFAMSQGGELGLVDRQTGDTRYLKPMHPDGKTELRFNWNAALAQDPFRPQGIYFGSQFLHYSPDLGQNWQLISPDLTTSDTAKLHQFTSGGLTLDATSAENHCTIVAIAPSPVQAGVVWVGTDDGQVQLTRDDGKTWENLSKQMPGFPVGAWVPTIEVSAKNAGEAFVVVNNYRQNDWQPYLYHTLDFGKNWKRLVDASTSGVGRQSESTGGFSRRPSASTGGFSRRPSVREDLKNAGQEHPADNDASSKDKNIASKFLHINNFCLSVVQDPEVSNLLFLGTDQGLYVSLNYGQTWQHWPTEGFPCVPVQDMKIQARDGDLVLGTFGRAIWILDNLQVLRILAKSGPTLVDQAFKLYPAQPGILAEYRSYDGPRFAADATYQGQNKSTSVRIPVWVKPEAKGQDTIGTQQTKRGDLPKSVGKAKGKQPGPKTTPETEEEKGTREKKEKAELEKAAENKAKEDRAKIPTGLVKPGVDSLKTEPKPDGSRKKEKEKATVIVFSMTGDTLRHFKTELDTGFTSIMWNMDTKGVRFPSNTEPDKDQLEPGGGPRVLPGDYRVQVAYRSYRDSITVRVLEDPRLPLPAAERAAKAATTRDLYQTVDKAQRAFARLREAEKTIKLVEDQLANVSDSTKKEALKLGTTLRDSINRLKDRFFQQKEPKGIQRDPNNLNARLYQALGYIDSGTAAPNATTQIAIRQAKADTERLVERVNALFDQPWQDYRSKVEAVRYSLFKNFDKL